MTTQQREDPHERKPASTVRAEVRFPISTGKPFSEDLPFETSIGQVRDLAMAHFKVAADGQHAYYLTYNGDRLEDTGKIGDVDQGSKKIKLTLVKELIQG